MPIEANLLHVAAALVLLGSPLLARAQTSKPTLDYISQSVVEANTSNSPTIEEWTRKHPDEIVQTPADKGSDYGSGNIWDLKRPEQQDRKLEGRWCLRSTAEIDLAGGIRVRRIALFYQPLAHKSTESPCRLCLQKRAMHFEIMGAGWSGFFMNSRESPIPGTLLRLSLSKCPGNGWRSRVD
jgi:hypothetical protein